MEDNSRITGVKIWRVTQEFEEIPKGFADAHTGDRCRTGIKNKGTAAEPGGTTPKGRVRFEKRHLVAAQGAQESRGNASATSTNNDGFT